MRFVPCVRTSRRRRRGDARSDGHHRSSRGRVPHRTASSSSSSVVGVGVAAVRRRRIQRNVIWIKIPKLIIGHVVCIVVYIKLFMVVLFVCCVADDVIHVRVYCLHIHVICTRKVQIHYTVYPYRIYVWIKFSSRSVQRALHFIRLVWFGCALLQLQLSIDRLIVIGF